MCCENLPKADSLKALETERLLSYHDIPIWQRDNEYLLSGYRATTNSVSKSVSSILDLHNETVCIHSHLIGAAFFSLFQWYLSTGSWAVFEKATTKDILIFSIFFIGVANCFILSASCHTLWNHSPNFASFGVQLDHLGIVLCIWASSVGSIYYGFHCNSNLQLIYGALVTVMALGCAWSTLSDTFRDPKFRAYRALMFAGLALSGMLFVCHELILHGWSVANKRMAIEYIILMALLNAVGVGFYAARMPERYWPKQFDIFGSSHQIFHVFVMLGALAHLQGLIKAFEFAHSPAGMCS